MLSQRGVFTYQEVSKPLEELIEATSTNEDAILFKIQILSSWREDVLKRLNGMNINYLSLFPDLEGAALYCNEKLIGEAGEDIEKLNRNPIWI